MLFDLCLISYKVQFLDNRNICQLTRQLDNSVAQFYGHP